MYAIVEQKQVFTEVKKLRIKDKKHKRSKAKRLFRVQA